MSLKTIQAPEFVVAKIAAPLPDYVIQEREAGKGQMLSYLSGATVIDILNATFGHLGWSFQILKEWKEESIRFFQKKTKWWTPPAELLTVNDKGEEGAWLQQAPVAWVHGRLTVTLKNDDGSYFTVTKEAFGSKSIIGKQSEQEHIFKSAQTDALKKAASLLGIGAELYRGEEEQQFFDVIRKPLVWNEKLQETEEWKKLMDIASACGWGANELNYYVTEYTEGEYMDIYTLPEAYIKEFIDYVKTALDEEE